MTRLVNRTERLTVIERMLFRSDNGLRAVEIAEACGVDRRTIYRDLSLLSDIGVPIFQKEGRFFINREHYLANVRLNQHELVALFVASRVLSHHADQQNPYLISALRKLSLALPEPVSTHVGVLTEAPSEPVDPGYIAALETIIQAWGERRKVKLWYSSTNDRETPAREFATYFIEPTPSGTLFVVGYDFFSQRVRPFALQRIKRVKLLRQTYNLPAHFDPRYYLSSAWGMLKSEASESVEVALLFSAEVTSFLNQRLGHLSQRIETADDGRCLLRVEVSDWRDMLPWIRSWGTQVEVIKPQALRELLAVESAQVAKLYGMNDGLLVSEVANEPGRSR